MSKESTYQKLIGDLYNIFNSVWKIPKKGKHPGAVLRANSRYRSLMVSNGTDAKHIQKLWESYYVIIKPDSENGLSKDTAFEKRPSSVSMKKMQDNDRIGHLSKADLDRLLEECFTPPEK